jgi:hypothetical protein
MFSASYFGSSVLKWRSVRGDPQTAASLEMLDASELLEAAVELTLYSVTGEPRVETNGWVKREISLSAFTRHLLDYPPRVGRQKWAQIRRR